MIENANSQTNFMSRYHCHTCKMVDGIGVCSICAKVCHADHDVTYSKYGRSSATVETRKTDPARL